MRAKTLWNRVVALKIEIVERRGVTVPSGNFRFFGANHVGRRLQMDAAAAEGPLDQRDFELDRCTGFDDARREEIDPGRTDILGDERDGDGFGDVANSGEP